MIPLLMSWRRGQRLRSHCFVDWTSLNKARPLLFRTAGGPGMAKRSTTRRELIDTSRNKMYAKRDVQGRFKGMDDVGHGDQGERARGGRKK